MPPVVKPSPPDVPAAAEEGWSSSRWDFALALALGAALVVFGWLDTRAYLASRLKPHISFTMTAPPGGVRIGQSMEFFRTSNQEYVRLENFSALEREWSHSFRHGLGPVSTLEIVAAGAHARLGIALANRIADQDLTVACNGRVLEHIAHAPEGPIHRSYPLDLQPGSNLITFTYGSYNHDGVHENPAEPRAVGVTFDALDLIVE